MSTHATPAVGHQHSDLPPALATVAAPAPVAWPGGNASATSFTFDVDAESVVLTLRPDMADRVTLMSQQAYGPREGVPRLLNLLRERGVRATFFVPGYTAERHPGTVEAILAGGHEVGHHGYLHESLVGLSEEQERDILGRGLQVLRGLGAEPVGYRAPFWEMNWHTPRLLAEKGFLYDSSLMLSDHPFELATEAGPLVELPLAWSADDWGQYCYVPEISGDAAVRDPQAIAALWRGELDALHAARGLWVLTNHCFLSGRPSRAAGLATVLDHALELGDTWVAPLGEIAAHVRAQRLEPVEFMRPSSVERLESAAR